MKKILALGTLVLGLSAGLSSCGGGSTPPTIDVTGKWVATLNGNVSAVYRLTLAQSGSTVSGDAEIATYVGTFTNLYDPFGKINGNVSGSQFTLNSSGTGKYGGSISLAGTVVAGKMTGSWSGTGAQGQSASGTFSASKE